MAQFLKIVPHEGVYQKYSLEHPDAIKVSQEFLVNLGQHSFIDFNGADEISKYEREKGIRQEILFRETVDGGEHHLSLFFDEAGMGEYHRYKRLIEQFCIGSTSNK